MSQLDQLAPLPVWHYFDAICAIPHPSYHEEALATYILAFAKKHNLLAQRDKTGNIFIQKPATKGMESRQGVVLQAHLDMVPQKNEDTVHDFTQDPIQTYIDDGWVSAKGTTLGADNGIGLATCLAVLASSDLPHGPIEALFTINEEAGMDGAFGLESGWLQGDILINTDSEQEGEVYVGCAGGIDAEISIALDHEPCPSNHSALKLTLKGLKGGHSGCDIHTGRANAIKLLTRFLFDYLDAFEGRVHCINGGSLRNAIPREASTIIVVPTQQIDNISNAFTRFLHLLHEELGQTETSIAIDVTSIEQISSVWTIGVHQRLLRTLHACPNGVIRMSDDFPGVVETSLNVGVINTSDGHVAILCLIRSLIDSGRLQVESRLKAVAALAGAAITFGGAYPGWKPDPNSQIMQLFRSIYDDIYGKKPNIMVIHAGLECGLFKKPYPDMDMISFGPTIKYPHSPDEKVEIASVALFWQQMCALLNAIPEK
ncbi:aminoacyl-histidine dipeptidase [Thaumasiovibrio sp. DFM-14]|uniref:aminoacyl-histidine dipeptidase n=1 Tax=Thaumasiovibrio sp. DFM-14 TaxID=3384792 RepID=UPI00399F4683